MRCQASNVHELLISHHIADEWCVNRLPSFTAGRPRRLSHLTWPSGIHDENVPGADNRYMGPSRPDRWPELLESVIGQLGI